MIQESLKVAVFQLDLVWENSVANCVKIDKWLQKTDQDADIVFLPEMFSTGFSMNVSDLAEPMNGETIQWMKVRSHEYQLALCGSLIIQDKGLYLTGLFLLNLREKLISIINVICLPWEMKKVTLNMEPNV